MNRGAYYGKRVLVTGGTGFIGGRLAERLVLEEGAQVRVLTRDWRHAVWVSRYPVDLVQGDIMDRTAVENAAQGCPIIFHCAGGADRHGYYGPIVTGTQTVVEGASAMGAERVVCLSSAAVHGPEPPNPCDELAPLVRVGRDYSDSRVAAEQWIQEFYRRTGFAVVVIRPTFVWGPRSALFTVRPLREMAAGEFSWIDEGQGYCQGLYVDNLVDGMLRAGLAKDVAGEAFLMTDGSRITWREFFTHYAELLGGRVFPSCNSRSRGLRWAAQCRERLDELQERLAGNPAPMPRRFLRRGVLLVRQGLRRTGVPTAWDLMKYSRRTEFDIGKARCLLGYTPRVDLECGMKETLAWAKDQLGVELGIAASFNEAGMV